MADNTSELRDFLFALDNLFVWCQRSLCNWDPIGAEHCKNIIEHYILIVVAIKAAVSENLAPNSTLSILLDHLVSSFERELTRLDEIVGMSFPSEVRRDVVSLLPSIGGRPAYNITKDQIEQLRETGMNWCSIAEFLGVSERTLQRRRIEFWIDSNFSDISDNDLDNLVDLSQNCQNFTKSKKIY